MNNSTRGVVFTIDCTIVEETTMILFSVSAEAH